MSEKKSSLLRQNTFLRNVAVVQENGETQKLTDQQIKEAVKIIEMRENGYDAKVVKTRRGPIFGFYKPRK